MSIGQGANLFTPGASGGGSGGGGGGSSMRWAEPANSAQWAFENNFEVYLFGAGLAQELYTAIRVPSSYTAGNPIKLLVEWYSADTSGNVLLRAQSTLVRAGTDAITSTTNQRTATNAAVTLGAGTVNEPQKIILDITNTDGTVNSVAVAAGDLLNVRMYRDTDTATGDILFVLLSAEATFT